MAVLAVSLGVAGFAGISLLEGAALPDPWTSPTAVGLALLGMALVSASSVVHRGLRARRLASRLEDEGVLSAASSTRAEDLSALMAAADTINDARDPDATLRILLDEALRFFEAGSGSIMLLDGAGFLQTACARGNERAAEARVKIGHSVAGHVALTREPLLLQGPPSPERFSNLVARDRPVESAMSVPLIHRGEVLGVLNVTGEDRAFTDHDLQLAVVFAALVSVAVGTARILDSARHRVSQLAELNRGKSGLIRAIAQDLRGPVAALSDEVDTLRRLDRADEAAREAVARIETQVERLSRSLEGLPHAGPPDGEPPPFAGATTDLRELAGTVALDFEATGQPVEVDAPLACVVTGDQSLLQQVLWNLVENAFQHGAPPVRIEVRLSRDAGTISVIDSGRGIAPDDRDRMDGLSSGSPEHAGRGLGLSIAHAIVSGCGGRIWAEQAREGGAVFHVAIPLAGHAADADALRGVSA